MFEKKLVFDQLYEYLISNGLLFESQYGFRKQHSTELAVLELTDRIRREIDQNKIPFLVQFWYKFVNKSLPEYFGTIFTFNNE